MTLPRLGFSLAESGRTMPDLVLVSASTRLTRILSPRGRSLAMWVAPSVIACVIGYLLLATCYLWGGKRSHPSECSRVRGTGVRAGPAGFVVAAEDAGHGVEEEVEVG